MGTPLVCQMASLLGSESIFGDVRSGGILLTDWFVIPLIVHVLCVYHLGGFKSFVCVCVCECECV